MLFPIRLADQLMRLRLMMFPTSYNRFRLLFPADQMMRMKMMLPTNYNRFHLLFRIRQADRMMMKRNKMQMVQMMRKRNEIMAELMM
jgi:hypothetical protein